MTFRISLVDDRELAVYVNKTRYRKVVAATNGPIGDNLPYFSQEELLQIATVMHDMPIPGTTQSEALEQKAEEGEQKVTKIPKLFEKNFPRQYKALQQVLYETDHIPSRAELADAILAIMKVWDASCDKDCRKNREPSSAQLANPEFKELYDKYLSLKAKFEETTSGSNSDRKSAIETLSKQMNDDNIAGDIVGERYWQKLLSLSKKANGEQASAGTDCTGVSEDVKKALAQANISC